MYDTGKVIIDGDARTITVKSGTIALDVQVDLYSDWKTFVTIDDNAKFLPAFRTTGGDPLTGATILGRYFFLINNWQLVPVSGTLGDVVITGNIFQDDGLPIVNNSGSNVQLYQNIVSSLTVITEISHSSMTAVQDQKLSDAYDATGVTTASLTEVITSQSFADIDHNTIIISQSLADGKLDTLIGAGGSLTPSQSIMLTTLYELMGLDPTKPLVVTPVARTVTGSFSQSINFDGTSATVTRTS